MTDSIYLTKVFVKQCINQNHYLNLRQKEELLKDMGLIK
jgi:hypothetical protein